MVAGSRDTDDGGVLVGEGEEEGGAEREAGPDRAEEDAGGDGPEAVAGPGTGAGIVAEEGEHVVVGEPERAPDGVDSGGASVGEGEGSPPQEEESPSLPAAATAAAAAAAGTGAGQPSPSPVAAVAGVAAEHPVPRTSEAGAAMSAPTAEVTPQAAGTAAAGVGGDIEEAVCGDGFSLRQPPSTCIICEDRPIQVCGLYTVTWYTLYMLYICVHHI